MSIRKFFQPSKVSIEESNNDFLKFKAYIISDGVNNNNSEFLYESLLNKENNIYNKPILALYNRHKDDVEEHNSKLSIDDNGEVFEDYLSGGAITPCGVIPESSIITVEQYKGRNWIVVSGCIVWEQYAKQIARLIRRKKYKDISVEVEFLEYENVDGIDRVTKFNLLGFVILGEEYDPGISNAHLETHDYVIKYNKEQTIKFLMSQYGIEVDRGMDLEKDTTVTTETQENFVEEPVKDTQAEKTEDGGESSNPVSEDEKKTEKEKKDMEKEYSVEEVLRMSEELAAANCKMAELEAENEKFKAEIEEMSVKYAEKDEELNKFKLESLLKFVDEKFEDDDDDDDLDEDDKKEVEDMVKEGKMSTEEDVVREMAYRKYTKAGIKKAEIKANKFSYSVEGTQTQTASDPLDKI